MVVAMPVNAARACPRLSSGCKRPSMLRRSPLSQARATCLMLVLVALTLPIHSARSQDRAMQDRLERLERDLSMLQRQVYRGGGSPPLAGGHNAAGDPPLCMDRLQGTVRGPSGPGCERA